MSTALATRSETALASVESPRGFLIIESFKQAQEVAEYINKSALVPDAYRGKPADIVIAMQYGMELGLSPMQALQSVAVVNGRPSLWGDALPGLIIALPDCEGIECPEPAGDNEEAWVATCKVLRRGKTPTVRTFSTKDAKVAGLWGANTWKKYPKRMLMMRARAFAIRDAYPDRMKGITTVEEASEIAPSISEPRRVGESATPDAQKGSQGGATPVPVAPADAAAAASPTGPAAASVSSPASPAPQPEGEVIAGVRVLENGVKWVDDGNAGYAEITTTKGVFVSRERGMFDSAASCEGSDETFRFVFKSTHRVKKGGGKEAIRVLLRMELDEGQPAQGGLPIDGGAANA